MDEGENTRPQPSDGEGHNHGRNGEKAVKPYEYTPLPDPEPAESGHNPPLAPKTLWIRLLTIRPGQYDDDIVVDLNDVALEATPEKQLRDKAAHSPGYRVSAAPHLEQYDALSYVWGSPANPSHVVVGEEGRILPITRNLDVAMRHFRYPDRPRVMWIDALCIDQTSSSDKSRQVAYMHLIYWSSPRVVVWLGPEADDSDHAMKKIGFIAAKIRVAWGREETSGVTEEDEAVWGSARPLNELPLDERDWAAIKSLIKRPWFSRIWIRQEVLFAEDQDAVQCGKSCITLNVFRRGLYRLTSRMYLIEAMTAAFVLRSVRYSIDNLRYIIRGAQCTDPRDYIYGTLGLLRGIEDLGIRPDYSKSVEEIFQDVVKKRIIINGGLRILEACGNNLLQDTHLSSPGNITLPSWVPDWTSGMHCPFFLSVERRFVRIGPWADFPGNGVLHVAGITKGVIQDFIELDATTWSGFYASLRRIVPKDAADIQYPGGGNLWDAYRVALCGDCFADGAVPAQPTFNLSYEDSRIALKSIIHGEERTWPNGTPEARYNNWVAQCGFAHRLFITENKLLGWAPKHAKEGDHIAIMPGGENPTLLRPVSSPDTEQYEVVGPCYLQGFMYGEGFLGPLPEGVRAVLHYEESVIPSYIYFKFLDMKSGEYLPRDPRVDAALLETDQSWAWRPGQTRLLRVQIEDLRSAGLDIRYFNLV